MACGRPGAQPPPFLKPIGEHDVSSHSLPYSRATFGDDYQTVAQRERLLQALADIGWHRLAMHALERQIGDQIVEFEDTKGRAGILYALDDLALFLSRGGDPRAHF